MFSEIKQEKRHPLELREKDLPHLSKQMLNAIGIFTENGDIKPAVLNILDQQREKKPFDKKNQQFRLARKYDKQHSN